MVATAFVVIVAALHVIFAAGESIGWSGMAARFGYSKEKIEHTRKLALNQGAYNLGVAAMLGVGLATDNAAMVQTLLWFIVAMAVVGGASVRWTIFAIQGVPALVALGATMAATPSEDAKVSLAVDPVSVVDVHATHRPWTAKPRFDS